MMSAHGSTEAYSKYREAAALAWEAYSHAVGLVVDGGPLGTICAAGDRFVNERSAGQINGGICHPLTVQLDNVVCNHAPNVSNEMRIEKAQIVKLQIGVHVDGYGVVVGGNVSLPEATFGADRIGKVAKTVVMLMRDVIKPGVTNRQISQRVNTYLDSLGYKGIPGLLAHSHSQFDIQGPKCINLFPSESETDGVGITFQEGEVYTAEVWLTDANSLKTTSPETLEATLYQIPPTVNVNGRSEQVQKAYDSITGKVGTFPFHSRAVSGSERELNLLRKEGVLSVYAPVSLEERAVVSQSVVSFVVTRDGAEILCPEMLAV